MQKNKITLSVGDRVKVDMTEIPKNQRLCETGEVTKIYLMFRNSPEYRKKVITITFDDNYIKEKYRYAGGIFQYCIYENEINDKNRKYPVFIEKIKLEGGKTMERIMTITGTKQRYKKNEKTQGNR